MREGRDGGKAMEGRRGGRGEVITEEWNWERQRKGIGKDRGKALGKTEEGKALGKTEERHWEEGEGRGGWREGNGRP